MQTQHCSVSIPAMLSSNYIASTHNIYNCPGYFESYHDDQTRRHAVMRVHRRTYSVQCFDKIRFPQLRIKCGVAKSCT